MRFSPASRFTHPTRVRQTLLPLSTLKGRPQGGRGRQEERRVDARPSSDLPQDVQSRRPLVEAMGPVQDRATRTADSPRSVP